MSGMDWKALGPRALGRWMSAIENGQVEPPEALACLQETEWPGRTVGVTGPPGCGKSTLVAAMTRELRRRGESVGILAIDPSSHKTGGAVLGDRIRMMDLASDPLVIIRSLAARGHLGGLIPTVSDLARLLRAAGYEWVFVETVGVGQSEVEIAARADLTLVVQAPGLGDDVQALKRGLLEAADLWVVNKCDLPGADLLVRDLQQWVAATEDRVLSTSASAGTGVPELLDALARLEPNPRTEDSRRLEEVRSLALEKLRRTLDEELRSQPLPEGDTWSAAEKVVARLLR